MAEPEVGAWCRCIPKPEVHGGVLVGRVIDVGDGYVTFERPTDDDTTETTTVSTDDYDVEATNE